MDDRSTECDPRPSTSRAELEALRQYLAELHRDVTSEEAAYLVEHMRDDSAPAWDRSINAPSRE
jgi:hypothetical protein